MDKHEFNIKVEQIRKLVNKGDYETAMKIADAIDWRKVPNANLLSMVSQVYEKNGEYQEAKNILLMAFERVPIGKRLLYKLAELALKEGEIGEAEDYYREFCDLAGDDPRQHLLRYMILKEKGAPKEQLVHTLESYTSEEMDEKWLYRLAELYHETGDDARCLAACDKIILMFGLGKYVDKAMELKQQFAPLTRNQMDQMENREKYEARLQAVETSFQDGRDGNVFFGKMPEEMSGITSVDARAKVEEMEETISQNAMESAESIEREETFVPKEAFVPEVIAMPGRMPVPEPFGMTQFEEPSVGMTYGQEAMEMEVRQAEAEARLAEEMSKLSETRIAETEDALGKTRIMGDIRRAVRRAEEQQSTGQNARGMEREQAFSVISEKPEPVQEEMMPQAEEAKIDLPGMPIHLMVEARTPEKGLELAVETLKRIRKETGIKNPVAKITGSKLNKKGVLASAEKLAGRDLVIEEAGDLSPEMLRQLGELMQHDVTGMRIVLIDNPKQMQMLHATNPVLASRFERIGFEETKQEDDRPVRHVTPVRDSAMRAPDRNLNISPNMGKVTSEEEEMDIDAFAQYACQYAAEIDCSITGKSMLALYERIEIMEEDGIPLTKENAQDLIEKAADKAEKPSFIRRIKNIFSSKYDKEGLLILKEEHFI